MKIGRRKQRTGSETNHKFKDFKMLVTMHNKKHRKIVESRIISNYN